MGLQGAAVVEDLDVMLELERPRLVRLCAHLAGGADVAEDLAQETLLEAWRQGHKVRDREGHTPWLAAIARNVCRRWARARARNRGRGFQPHPVEDNRLSAHDDELADGFDLEVELEREELAALLDRALGLLPPQTRLALVQKYILDCPQAEIAARLGVSEGAVEVRLHRGKLALRRILATDLRQDALAYGLLAAPAGWQQTRIWCPVCGARHLVGRSLTPDAEFSLRCPGCFPAYDAAPPALNIAQAASAEELGGVKGFKPALTRIMAAWDTSFTHARVDGHVLCPGCGQAIALRMSFGPHVPGSGWPAGLSMRGIHWWCERCGPVSNLHLLSLTLYGPTGRRFWRAHPRIRMLPEREIDAEGRPALLTRYESVTDRASLEVVSARDTYAVLRVSCTPHV